MPLNPVDCPLVEAELVTLYNKLEEIFQQIRQKLPKLYHVFEALANDAAAKIAAARAANLKISEPEHGPIGLFRPLEERFKRKAYRVGFLGRSQIGKSSTFNNVLGVRKEDGPASEGEGKAATSTATRLYRVEPGQAPRCRLYFMTPAEFQERRNDLCTVIGLPTTEVKPDKSSDQIKSENQKYLDQVRPFIGMHKSGQPSADTEIEKDRQYFMRLLECYQADGPRLVKNPRVEEAGDYAARRSYTNHPEGGKPSQYLLLREVEIGFPTDRIHPNVEMIDLPGLSTKLQADDKLTQAYLPTLDGALMCQSAAENIANRELYSLVSKLSSQFGGSIAGRLWVTYTYLDSAQAKNKLYGGTENRTLFDNIAETLVELGVPLKQAVFVGNEYYKDLQIELAKGSSMPPGEVAKTFGLQKDEDTGEPILPPALERHPELKEAYNNTLKDGGIGALREVIGTSLATQVREAVRKNARQTLCAIATELSRRLDVAKKQAAMNIDEIVAASSWGQVLNQVSSRVESERIIEGPSRKLADELHKLFSALCNLTADATPVEIADLHENRVMMLLKEVAQTKLPTETLGQIHRLIASRIDEESRKIQNLNVPVHFADGLTPSEALTSEFDRNGEFPDWVTNVFDSFTDVPLFIRQNDIRNPVIPALTPDEYRKTLEVKIEATVHEVAHRIAGRVRATMYELRKRLDMLGNQASMDRASGTIYDLLRNNAEEIRRAACS